MTNASARTATLAAVIVPALAACMHPVSTSITSDTRPLQARILTLESRKSLLEDANAVKRLQGPGIGSDRCAHWMHAGG